MAERQATRAALGVAMLRAVHQELNGLPRAGRPHRASTARRRGPGPVAARSRRVPHPARPRRDLHDWSSRRSRCGGCCGQVAGWPWRVLRSPRQPWRIRPARPPAPWPASRTPRAGSAGGSVRRSEGLEKWFTGDYHRVMLDGVGHFPHREDAESVAERVHQHLRRHRR
jgi:hypothetical protein